MYGGKSMRKTGRTVKSYRSITAMRKRSGPDSDINDKQKAFVNEYFKDYNTTNAAKRAGYSESCCSAIGCRLKKDPRIKRLMKKEMIVIRELAHLEAADVLQEMMNVATANLADYIKWDSEGNISIKPSADIPRELMGFIEEISQTTGKGLKIKLRDRDKMLELLAKHYKLFEAEGSGNQSKELKVTVTPDGIVSIKSVDL